MSTESVKPILVLGGTGHLGRQIVASLLSKNVPVRVLSRHAEAARRLLGESVEIVAGDITEPDSVKRALAGVAGMVISVSAFSPALIRRLVAIERDAVLMALGEAARAGVARVVYISVFAIDRVAAKHASVDRVAGIKSEIENALRQLKFNWTVLGQPPSTEIFFRMIRKNTMVVPGGGPPAMITISPRDTGEIAAQAVLRQDLAGMRFSLCGPDVMSFPAAAQRIAAVAGWPIGFRKIPLLLPKIAAFVTWPLTPFSATMLFVNRMLGFVKLLNAFPPEFAAQAPRHHQLLRDTFSYTPTTLEDDAREWLARQAETGNGKK